MAAMPSNSALLLLVAASLLVVCSAGGTHHQRMEVGGWSAEGEWEMESEWSRRILAGTTNYISYDALKRDSVPCSRRGASYYNCRPGASANPYTRGCSAITMCRS